MTKPPNKAGLRRPWPRGVGGSEYHVMSAHTRRWAGVVGPEDAVSELGEVGTVGPPAQGSPFTEPYFRAPGRGPGRY